MSRGIAIESAIEIDVFLTYISLRRDPQGGRGADERSAGVGFFFCLRRSFPCSRLESIGQHQSSLTFCASPNTSARAKTSDSQLATVPPSWLVPLYAPAPRPARAGRVPQVCCCLERRRGFFRFFLAHRLDGRAIRSGGALPQHDALCCVIPR